MEHAQHFVAGLIEAVAAERPGTTAEGEAPGQSVEGLLVSFLTAPGNLDWVMCYPDRSLSADALPQATLQRRADPQPLRSLLGLRFGAHRPHTTHHRQRPVWLSRCG